MNIHEKLMNIQSELKAPKNQYSDFGKYHYRSCEDILEGLKPLLKKYRLTLILDDEVVQIGERYYIKSTAKIIDVEAEQEGLTATAYAREDENKAKMDLSQMTGSATSYARKYALNGLFAIDDTKDADATNNHGENQIQAPADENKKSIEDNSLVSDKQLNLIYKLVKDKNYSSESMAKYISEAFGKKSSKELTKKEASELIKMLNEMER